MRHQPAAAIPVHGKQFVKAICIRGTITLESFCFFVASQRVVVPIQSAAKEEYSIEKFSIHSLSGMSGCLPVCLFSSPCCFVLLSRYWIGCYGSNRIKNSLLLPQFQQIPRPDQTRTWPIQKVLRCEIYIYVLGPFRKPENRLPGRERESRAISSTIHRWIQYWEVLALLLMMRRSFCWSKKCYYKSNRLISSWEYNLGSFRDETAADAKWGLLRVCDEKEQDTCN